MNTWSINIELLNRKPVKVRLYHGIHTLDGAIWKIILQCFSKASLSSSLRAVKYCRTISLFSFTFTDSGGIVTPSCLKIEYVSVVVWCSKIRPSLKWVEKCSTNSTSFSVTFRQYIPICSGSMHITDCDLIGPEASGSKLKPFKRQFGLWQAPAIC